MEVQGQGVGRVHSILRTLLGLQMAVFSLGLFSVRCLCPNILIASYKGTSPIGWEPTLMTLLSCNYLLKALSSIQSYSRILGLGTSTCEFWAGHNSTRNTDIKGLHLYSTTWQAVMLLGLKSIWVMCWDLSLTLRLKVASCSDADGSRWLLSEGDPFWRALLLLSHFSHVRLCATP